MKILEIPFETIYKCNWCGCKFEIEPNDLSFDRIHHTNIDGEIRKIAISMYVNCPYCDNEIEIKRNENGK